MAARMLQLALVLASMGAPRVALAEGPSAVLEVEFTPTPRAQIAAWIEDGQGRFLANVALTESVAFRGLGNRPGASQMNSGYRWPYGRREGVLPVWGRRRATAFGALQFRRVIFQDRTSEGLASRTSSDYSVDNYYCLSFNRDTTTRDALDAVSCASVFTSDKGRFVTDADVASAYAEPWTKIDDASVGRMMPMPLHSFYPPRMDAAPCGGTACFDHEDLSAFASHAREVMPEIDAITMATPPGGVPQSLLFTIPTHWPGGDYRLLVEVNTEGDYNDWFNDQSYPTPAAPPGAWDSWAMSYGYAYRGQPSVVYEVPFELSQAGEQVAHSDAPIGRSSWRHWDADYGELESLEPITDDANAAPGSGADRLLRDGDGHRLSLTVRTLSPFEPPSEGQDPWADVPLPDRRDPPAAPADESSDEPTDADASDESTDSAVDVDPVAASGAGAPAKVEDAPGGTRVDQDSDGGAIILTDARASVQVGAVRGLEAATHPDRLHAHDWVVFGFLAADSDQPLHSYEVRVSTVKITDEATFIRDGRPAKTASEDAEGAVSLMLPTDVAAGEPIESEIGDLVAETTYWIGVRAKDVFDRKGPISVVEVTTRPREFATVTACFVATAAYGTPLAVEVGSLRRFRDRFLLSHAPGRWLVAHYYAHGPALAGALHGHPWLRRGVRALLSPLVALARAIE